MTHTELKEKMLTHPWYSTYEDTQSDWLRATMDELEIIRTLQSLPAAQVAELLECVPEGYRAEFGLRMLRAARHWSGLRPDGQDGHRAMIQSEHTQCAVCGRNSLYRECPNCIGKEKTAPKAQE